MIEGRATEFASEAGLRGGSVIKKEKKEGSAKRRFLFNEIRYMLVILSSQPKKEEGLTDLLEEEMRETTQNKCS